MKITHCINFLSTCKDSQYINTLNMKNFLLFEKKGQAEHLIKK